MRRLGKHKGSEQQRTRKAIRLPHLEPDDYCDRPPHMNNAFSAILGPEG
jgi:hypothetical protein